MSIAIRSSNSRFPVTPPLPNTGNVLTQPLSRLPRHFVAWLRHLSTPILLQLLLGTTWLCVLLLWLAAYTGVGVHRSGLQHIGRETGPGLIQVQKMRAALADMDASIVRQMLISPDDQSHPEERDALATYRARRDEFATALIEAAGNITTGQAERDSIIKLQREVGDYDSLVPQASLQGDGSSKGYDYDPAAAKMHSILLIADDLINSKYSALDETYQRQSGAQNFALFCLILSGLLLIAILITAQYMLFQRTRRLINPGLAVATLLTAVLFWGVAISLGDAASELRFAKEENFDTLKDMAQARSLAYESRALEGRWLLFLQSASLRDANEKAFSEKVGEVKSLLGAEDSDHSSQGTPYFSSLNQFNNYKTAHDLLIHQGMDRDYPLAFQSYLGFGSTTSDTAFTAFNTFDSTLSGEIERYHDTFKNSIDDGLNLLDNRELYISLLALAIAASAFIGIAPRLKEYTI